MWVVFIISTKQKVTLKTKLNKDPSENPVEYVGWTACSKTSLVGNSYNIAYKMQIPRDKTSWLKSRDLLTIYVLWLLRSNKTWPYEDVFPLKQTLIDIIWIIFILFYRFFISTLLQIIIIIIIINAHNIFVIITVAVVIFVIVIVTGIFSILVIFFSFYCFIFLSFCFISLQKSSIFKF